MPKWVSILSAPLVIPVESFLHRRTVNGSERYRWLAINLRQLEARIMLELITRALKLIRVRINHPNKNHLAS